jgi:hypothetical protein
MAKRLIEKRPSKTKLHKLSMHLYQMHKKFILSGKC